MRVGGAASVLGQGTPGGSSPMGQMSEQLCDDSVLVRARSWLEVLLLNKSGAYQTLCACDVCVGSIGCGWCF